MSSPRDFRRIVLMPSSVASAMTAAKEPAVQSAASGDQVSTGFHGTPNTKAAAAPKRGEAAQPSARPAARAPAPTRVPSSARMTAISPPPIPSSA